MAKTGSRGSRKSGAKQECPTCHEKVVPDNGYCTNCGSPMNLAAAPASGAPAGDGSTATATATTCPVCGTAVPPGEEFCPSCGAPVAALSSPRPASPAQAAASSQGGAVACSVCGSQIPEGEEYCPSCGAPRSASTALPATQATEAAETPAQHEAAEHTNCPNCQAPLRPGARFCRECGYRFAPVSAQVAGGPATSQLQVGRILANRYKIVSVIGGGGMGTVFKGVDLNLRTRNEPEGRPSAVKAIINTEDPDLLAAAVEEREMLIRLDHPNIVRIYDIVTEGGIPYIVMAFVKGTSWKELYDKNGGPLGELHAIRLLLGIRGAFEYLHGRTPPVVYRDFKPGNVIQVEESNGEKRQVLIDLGTAVEYFPGQKREAWGTVGFAPPEIGGVCEQPPTMDLYGLTSALAALLGVDVNEQLIGVPPRSSWPVSQEIYDLVERGRDPDPRNRFQSVTELFDQLEGIARFIEGQERARVRGTTKLAGTTTSPLSGALIPVQSTIFTGRLFNTGNTGKIGALPSLSTADPASQMLQPARDLLAAGRYADALTQIEATLKSYPASIDSHLLRAAALSNMGHASEATQALQQANRLSTPATRWRTLLVEAQAAETANEYGRAEKLYQELIKLVPGEVLPKQALADIYRETGRYEPAADLYTRVVSADPANADAVLGLADSLVALNQTDQAIGVLDAVNENALRYVDAQMRLVELYLLRIDAYMERQPERIARANPSDKDIQELLRDLDLAGRAIAGLYDHTESRLFYRLEADWWYAAYRLAKAKKLPADIPWPDRAKHTPDPHEIGRATREAYRRYLQRSPDAPDREDVLARIYFDVEEWQ